VDRRVLSGEFWLPRTRQRVPGRLEIDEDGYAVWLDQRLKMRAAAGYSVAVVHGSCRGYPVTLFDGLETSISALESKVDFPEVVLGDHITSTRQPVFREVAAQISGLRDFVGLSGLNIEQSMPSGANQRAMAIGWEPVKNPEATVNDVRIRFQSNAGVAPISDYEFRLTHDVWVSLQSRRAKSLDRWRDQWLGGLESLVALGVDAPSPTTSWFALRTPAGKAGPRGRSVEILSRSRPTYGTRYQASPMQEPFLTLEGLGKRSKRALRGFYLFRRRYREPAELLFEYQVLGGALTPADRMLYLARFLESFHRIRGPKGARSFRVRLLDLFQGLAAPASPYFGATPSDLARVVVATRNYYVHYNPKDRPKAVHGIALDYLADRLWQIVRACVLSEIGVPSNLVAEALARDGLAPQLSSRPLDLP
jgi:hypothetical protein